MPTPRSAKDLQVAPISPADANTFVKSHHYSGRVVRNSLLHLGVFLDRHLEGVMQFGPSLDKRKLQNLVRGTPWYDFVELNRMAFTDRLPRNSESRALGVALRMIRKEYPTMQWVISFADATQCGDGTIYRAAGFVLTGIRRNTSIWAAPDGTVATNLALREGTITKSAATTFSAISKTSVTKAGHAINLNGSASMRAFIERGYRPLPGFQMRYIYFLDASARDRLTVPVVPFAKIDEMGVGMYRGKARVKQAMAECPSASGGAAPTHALHDRRRRAA